MLLRLEAAMLIARVYKRRERECPIPVQTPFAKYRGQYGQHYIKVTTNQYRYHDHP